MSYVSFRVTPDDGDINVDNFNMTKYKTPNPNKCLSVRRLGIQNEVVLFKELSVWSHWNNFIKVYV